MARNIAKTPVRVAWAAALCSLTLGVTLWTASGGAQLPGQAPPLRARDALKAAHEHYKRRDYDTAARYFEHARMAQGELTATERQDLTKLMQQNAVALHASHAGGAIVRQAEQALQMGNPQEASRLVRLATANQYLSGTDRQALAALNDQLRRGSRPQAAPGEIVLDGTDAKSLLAGARKYMERGDLDFAEALAKEADEKSGAFTWLPWGDSPSKVRRDIQAARAKQPAPTMPPHTVHGAPGAPGVEKDGRPVMGKVRNMFTPPWLRDKNDGDAKQPELPHHPQSPEMARQPAVQPMIQPAVPSHPTEYGPRDLGPLTTAPQNVPANLSPAEARAQAQRLIQEGYRYLDARNFDAARQYAYQAKALRADLSWNERNPDRLLADIQSREGGPANTAANPGTPGAKAVAAGTPADAKLWIKQARTLIQREQFDDAEKLCDMAASVPSVRWGLFEDSPDRVRADLTELRTRRNKEQSAALMVEARKLLAAGNLAQAKAKAYQAQQLHGPYSWWEMGERPQRLLEEIARAETGSGKAPGLPNDNPLNPNQLAQQSAPADRGAPAPVNLVSATTQAAARNQAKTLILQARELERGGFLVEARQKALEADALGVMFTPDEDNPRAVLLSLASKCDLRIAQLLQQATDFVQSNPNDPTRFQKAEINIHQARRLADAFGLDPAVIDQRTEWLQKTTGRTIRPISGTNEGPGLAHAEHKAPVVPLDPGAQRMRQAGLEKLDKARLEIKAGNYAIARRIAEEAFNPSYYVQSDAAMVLRTIDAEEHLQQMTMAQKNFEAGLEAYHRKDFARAGKIWQAVDLRLLPIERRRQLAEILELPEMRGSGIVRTHANVPAGDGPAGQTTVTDLADNPFKAYTSMEQIHAQKLRDRSLAAMDEALKLVQEKETQQAVDTLKEFLTTLQEAQISPDLKLPIRRNVEQKLQQYSTLLAQQQLVEQQKTALGGHNETLRTNNIQKRNEEVAGLMKEAHQLYKEGRFEQALAKARMAKEMDPDNYTVAGFIGQAETATRQAEFNKHLARNEKRFVEEVGMPDLGPSVTSRDPVHFDKEISERNRNRKNESFSWQTKDPVERAIERQLEQPIPGLNWKDTALSQVISDLQAMIGHNVVPDERALREAGVSLDLPMTLNVENIKLKSGLNLLLNKAKLTYVVKEQSLVITTEDHARSKVRTIVHPVADLIVPVKDHKLPEIHDLSAALTRHINAVGNINYGGLTPSNPAFGIPFQTGLPVGHYGNSMATGPNGQPVSTSPVVGPAPQTGHLQDVLIDLIKNTVANTTWRDVGGPGHIQYYPLGMALIVNQTLEVQEEVAALLQALRRLQDIEVAIEMKLVNVSEAFWERIGVDFDINIKTPHSRHEANLLSGQFTPFGSVNRNLGVNNVVSGYTPAGTLTSDLNIPLKNSSYNFTIPPFGGYPGTLGQDGGLSLGLAFLNDIQVFMLLEAAQGDRRANVMQAPKLTVFNGQSAFLTINDNQFFLTGVQVAIPNNGNQFVFVPVQQPFPLGVQMQVTPVVSADRRFVRIELFPSLTNLASATVPLIPVQIPIPQFFDGPGSGSSSNTQPQFFTMFFQQPTFTTISLNTTVRVPDGGTVLLGGLKTLSEGRHEHGPPVLGKIPYISRLFRNVAYGREAQSLMIMVTPRIIINEEEELIHLGDLPPVPRS